MEFKLKTPKYRSVVFTDADWISLHGIFPIDPNGPSVDLPSLVQTADEANSVAIYLASSIPAHTAVGPGSTLSGNFSQLLFDGAASRQLYTPKLQGLAKSSRDRVADVLALHADIEEIIHDDAKADSNRIRGDINARAETVINNLTARAKGRKWDKDSSNHAAVASYIMATYTYWTNIVNGLPAAEALSGTSTNKPAAAAARTAYYSAVFQHSAWWACLDDILMLYGGDDVLSVSMRRSTAVYHLLIEGLVAANGFFQHMENLRASQDTQGYAGIPDADRDAVRLTIDQFWAPLATVSEQTTKSAFKVMIDGFPEKVIWTIADELWTTDDNDALPVYNLLSQMVANLAASFVRHAVIQPETATFINATITNPADPTQTIDIEIEIGFSPKAIPIACKEEWTNSALELQPSIIGAFTCRTMISCCDQWQQGLMSLGPDGKYSQRLNEGDLLGNLMYALGEQLTERTLQGKSIQKLQDKLCGKNARTYELVNRNICLPEGLLKRLMTSVYKAVTKKFATEEMPESIVARQASVALRGWAISIYSIAHVGDVERVSKRVLVKTENGRRVVDQDRWLKELCGVSSAPVAESDYMDVSMPANRSMYKSAMIRGQWAKIHNMEEITTERMGTLVSYKAHFLASKTNPEEATFLEKTKSWMKNSFPTPKEFDTGTADINIVVDILRNTSAAQAARDAYFDEQAVSWGLTIDPIDDLLTADAVWANNVKRMEIHRKNLNDQFALRIEHSKDYRSVDHRQEAVGLLRTYLYRAPDAHKWDQKQDEFDDYIRSVNNGTSSRYEDSFYLAIVKRKPEQYFIDIAAFENASQEVLNVISARICETQGVVNLQGVLSAIEILTA